MAYYSRYRRRYRRAYGRYRRYGRYYGRYRRRSYARKYVNGSSRSVIRLKVPISSSQSFTQPANTQGTPGSLVACPFVPSNLPYSPLSSPLYRQYAVLYDEVKCIGVKSRISVVSSVGGSDIPALRIYSAWDRRFSTSEMQDGITFADIQAYSTAQVATAVNNSVAKIERSCWASDLMERAQWHDCSLATSGASIVDPVYSNSVNVNFFAPGLLLAFCVPNQTAATTINISVENTYYYAFRNPKWGAAVGSGAKSVAAPVDGGDVPVRSAAAVLDGPLDPTLVVDEDIEDDDFVDAEPLDVHDDVAALAEIARIEAERASASTAAKSTPVVVQKAGKAVRASSKNK